MLRVRLTFSLPNTGITESVTVTPAGIEWALVNFYEFGWVLTGYHYVIVGDLPGAEILAAI